MDLRKTLRKAAEFVMELPPETPKTQPSSPAASASSQATDAAPTTQLLSNLGAVPTLAESPAAGGLAEAVRMGATAASAQPPPDFIRRMDAAAIYQRAGVPEAAFGAGEALSFLNSISADLPLHSRQQMMYAMLHALSKNITVQHEDIVADATRKIAALQDFRQEHILQTTEYVTKLDTEITALQEQIAERQRSMETATSRQQELQELVESEVEQMQQVVTFFEARVPACRSDHDPHVQPL